MEITSRRKPKSSLFIDLTGQRFGQLVVEEFVGFSKTQGVWRCRCDCGKTTLVRTGSLRNLGTKSCGCRGRAGGTTREYHAWREVLESGAPVCKRWQESVEKFKADTGRRPSDFHRPMRPDPSKPWSPSNFEWRLPDDGRRTRRIEFRGKNLTIAQWAEELGISAGQMRYRLEKFPVEAALTTPPGEQPPGYPVTRRGPTPKPEPELTHGGETLPLSKWAERLGISAESLKWRLEEWDSVEAALTTPRWQRPPKRSGRYHKVVTFRGESLTVREWAKRLGIQAQSLAHRLEHWDDLERALTTPKGQAYRKAAPERAAGAKKENREE